MYMYTLFDYVYKPDTHLGITPDINPEDITIGS